MKELRLPPRRMRRCALQSASNIAGSASRGVAAYASTDAAIACWPAIPGQQFAPFQWPAKLNLRSWRSCGNRNRKWLLSTFYKSHFGRNESLIKRVPFGVTPLCKQSALQEPEFLNIMLCSRRHSRGALWLMFLYSSLKLAERSGCWSRLRAFRHGSHRLRKRAIWPAKQQPFFSTLCGFERRRFSNLKLRRKELHL